MAHRIGKIKTKSIPAPIFPPSALWEHLVGIKVEDIPIKKWCIMQVFGSWCVFDPNGVMFACEDSFEDAERAHNLFHTWAIDYCHNQGWKGLEDYFLAFHHEPYIIPHYHKSTTKYALHEVLGDPWRDDEPEPNYQDVEYEE